MVKWHVKHYKLKKSNGSHLSISLFYIICFSYSENIFCKNTHEVLLFVNIDADLAISLWSSILCCWSSAAMACWACCCIPCTKCCMCWKASIWRGTKKHPPLLKYCTWALHLKSNSAMLIGACVTLYLSICRIVFVNILYLRSKTCGNGPCLSAFFWKSFLTNIILSHTVVLMRSTVNAHSCLPFLIRSRIWNHTCLTVCDYVWSTLCVRHANKT